MRIPDRPIDTKYQKRHMDIFMMYDLADNMQSFQWNRIINSKEYQQLTFFSCIGSFHYKPGLTSGNHPDCSIDSNVTAPMSNLNNVCGEKK